MKVVLALAVLIALGALWHSQEPSFQLDEAVYRSEFLSFVSEFGKSYLDESEYQQRFTIFRQNLDDIVAHNNKEGNTFELGVNHLTDLTDAEYQKMLGYNSNKNSPSRQNAKRANLDHIEPAASIDWLERGAVTSPAKDQGSCGSCWAFSAVGALEGHNFLCTGKLQEFSEQQLVDCSHEDGSNGCKGGEMTGSFKFWKTHIADFEDEYVYEAKDNTCKMEIEETSESHVHVNNYYEVQPDDFTGLSLKKALNIKPCSIGVHAGQNAFKFYKKGILTDCAPAPIDHGIVAIGYGTDEETGQEFFFVKNSWGNRWGEKGFGIIAINNECGITHDPLFPDESCIE